MMVRVVVLKKPATPVLQLNCCKWTRLTKEISQNHFNNNNNNKGYSKINLQLADKEDKQNIWKNSEQHYIHICITCAHSQHSYKDALYSLSTLYTKKASAFAITR